MTIILKIHIVRNEKDKKSRGGKAGKGWALFLNELLSLHNNTTILQSHSVAASFSYFAIGWDLFIATGGLFFFLSFFSCRWFYASHLG